MLDEHRISRVLEDVLASKCAPEELCADDPNMLSEVRRRLHQIRGVELELDEMFPSPNQTTFNPAERPSQAGQSLPQLDGYDVEEVLGRGGMGVVYRARHRTLNRPVAVKMILAGAYAGPRELGRFRQEAEAVAGLRHPNIVQVYDAGEVDGRPYFTMEIVEGGSLARQLSGTPQPLRRAAELVAVLACAVEFAHRSGIVHRDLKPGNILLAADGTPKITDFGLAHRVEGGPEFTLTGDRLGTPSYMAPEQALGKTRDIGPPVDIYALGAILYELLTGRPPFIGDTAAETERQVIAEDAISPSRLNPKVPRDLETICLKCLHKAAARRPPLCHLPGFG
jgi:serine/threonine-protein kinase